MSLSIVALYGSKTIPQVQIWVERHGRCDMLFNSNSISVAVKGATTAWLIADPMTNVSFPYTLKPFYSDWGSRAADRRSGRRLRRGTAQTD